MGLFDRVSRLLRANVNDMVSKAEDPEKILEQAVMDMQEDLVQLRQAVASSIANITKRWLMPIAGRAKPN
jgi:phage shock protein A